MPARRFRPLVFLVTALALSASFLGSSPAGAAGETPPVPPSPYPSLGAALKAGFIKQESVDLAAKMGTAPIVIQLLLPTPFQPEGNLAGGKGTEAQRAAIKTVQDALVQKLSSFKPEHIKRYQTIPHLALELNSAGLDALVKIPNLARVDPDRQRAASLSASVPYIGGDKLRNSNNSSLGSGQSVAILDTGVESTHSFLSGRVVSEACFSTDSWWHNTDSFCPNGGDSQSGSGTAAPCPLANCEHGTHVAGIAAGRGTMMNGVAPEANIIAIKVFQRENDGDDCQSAGLKAPCPLARDSDVIGALDFAQQIGPGQNLAAVNLSLGGGAYNNQSDCDSDNSDWKDAIDNLRSIGIATVVAAGNSGMVGLAAPACISSAISVGAINPVSSVPESVAGFSQTASFLSLLAPGTNINSSVTGNGFGTFSGTSMAAPHVTGAWAALRSVAGNQNVQTVLNALTSTGTLINDARTNVRKPRINLVGAAEQLVGKPLAPSNLRVTSISGTSAILAWNDNSQSETTFALEYQVPSGLWIVGATPAANATSGTITGLSPNTAYNFRVMACQGPNCSGFSNVVTATTLNTLPATPSNLRASNVTNHTFDFAWDEVSTNPFTSFDIYSNVTGTYSTVNVGSTTRTISYSALSPNTSYYMQVRACNADGCSAYSGYLLVQTLTIVPIPAAPTNLHACGTQPFELCFAGWLTLLWTDNASNETSYELQSTVAIIGQNPFTGPWNSVTLAANSTSDFLSPPTSGTLNYYRVRACNAGGCSNWSNTLMYTAP